MPIHDESAGEIIDIFSLDGGLEMAHAKGGLDAWTVDGHRVSAHGSRVAAATDRGDGS